MNCCLNFHAEDNTQYAFHYLAYLIAIDNFSSQVRPFYFFWVGGLVNTLVIFKSTDMNFIFYNPNFPGN